MPVLTTLTTELPKQQPTQLPCAHRPDPVRRHTASRERSGGGGCDGPADPNTRRARTGAARLAPLPGWSRQMNTRYCGHCGHQATKEDSFCVGCGKHLRAVSEVPADVAPTDTAQREDQIVLRHALELLARREVSTALTVLEKLCAERPEWAVARAYLGIAYLRTTRVADAREELEAAVQLAPDSFICRSKYGEFLARLGFYDQAMRELDIALSLPAPDGESRYAAMELRQFSKDKSKGLFYRQNAYPKLGRLLPTRFFRQPAPIPERGH